MHVLSSDQNLLSFNASLPLRQLSADWLPLLINMYVGGADCISLTLPLTLPAQYECWQLVQATL